MTQRIVIKVGGASLFSKDGFQSHLRPLLEEFRREMVYVMVGGGELVEAMRSAHRIYPSLSTEEIHWQCVELLDKSWSIASTVYPLDENAYDRGALDRFTSGEQVPKSCWVRVQGFYSQGGCDSLPVSWLPSCNWNTTTDALAWLLGMIVDADRVVLLKQCKIDKGWSMDRAAEVGVVDTEIARLSRLHHHRLAVELRSVSH